MTVSKKERFHDFKKCSKCGRSVCKDRTLDADAWLILFYGDKNCDHIFKSVTRKEASVYV